MSEREALCGREANMLYREAVYKREVNMSPRQFMEGKYIFVKRDSLGKGSKHVTETVYGSQVNITKRSSLWKGSKYFTKKGIYGREVNIL